MNTRIVFFSFFGCLLPALACFAQPTRDWWKTPEWWTDLGVITSDPADDYAVVNQGQVKNVATKAYDFLEANLSGGAGAELDGLISDWNNPGPNVDNYATMNVGELKYIASKYYDRLIETGYANQYPWTDSQAQSDDYALANIGQLKYLFSFDLREESEIFDAELIMESYPGDRTGSEFKIYASEWFPLNEDLSDLRVDIAARGWGGAFLTQ